MEDYHYRYTTVTGYFSQDDPLVDATTFDHTSTSLGLIEQPYDTDATVPALLNGAAPSQWQRFAHKLKCLNDKTTLPPDTRYVLLYAARHGEGWHNRAMAHYGPQEWDGHWSTRDGDGQMIWADADLTDIGAEQARALNAFWKKEIRQQVILTPERFFVSPLLRCLRTAELTWSDIQFPQQTPSSASPSMQEVVTRFDPEIKELLRENIGVHTCDRRSSRTKIRSVYPSYRLEPGFAETDLLWRADERESEAALTRRLRVVLDDIVQSSDHEETTVFSLTSHSGAIRALLRVIGHRSFGLPTGGIIPLLVKVERVSGAAP